MTPRTIIAEAWHIAQNSKPLWHWGFAVSFFEALRTLQTVLTQGYYLYGYLSGTSANLSDVADALATHLPAWLLAALLLLFIALLLIGYLFPTFAQGAIIGLSAKVYRREEAKGGLVLALSNFLPLFEKHGLFVLSRTALLITIVSLMLRYLDGSMLYAGIIALLILWLISNAFSFFALFADEGIVIKRKGVFASVARSTKLNIGNVGHVTFLLLLIFLISIRIAINAALVLVVPLLVVGAGALLAFILPPLISYALASMLGLGVIILASYLLAYVSIFRQTVWTIAFLELDKGKDLDVIIEDEDDEKEDKKK
jgi:hypothetical protein